MNAITERFKEPSSYSAIAAVLAMVGLHVPADVWQSVVLLGCGVAGVLGFWLREKK